MMFSDKLMRITLFVSLAGHCLFLGVPGFGNSIEKERPLEQFIVNIQTQRQAPLPDIKHVGDEKRLQSARKEQRTVQERRDTDFQSTAEQVSADDPQLLDNAKEAMLRYQDMVKRRIEQVRKYPAWAQRQQIEGAVYVRFMVFSTGVAGNIRIIRASGSIVLDQEAQATIKRAQPFPPLPEDINRNSVSMEVAIVFEMK